MFFWTIKIGGRVEIMGGIVKKLNVLVKNYKATLIKCCFFNYKNRTF